MRAPTPSSASSSGTAGSPAKAVQRAAPATCSEAQRRAAVILEVLAGVRSASQGAAALGISVNHYYLLERQALGGLVAACAPRPKGQRLDAERQLRTLEQTLERSRRECQRQAALVRATQRAVGLPATPPERPAGKARRGKAGPASVARRRRTSVRALRLARAMTAKSLAPEAAAAVQPTAGSDHPLSAHKEPADGTSGT
jgi:hypothetical protein